MNPIVERKSSHLELCIRDDVEAHTSALFEQVYLVHEALPELSVDDIDLSVELFGRRLQAPLVISGMSGGPARGGELNRTLAAVAQELGLGMGVGSQRAMLLDPSMTSTYMVRDVAPDILLFANLGAVQARQAGAERVAELAQRIGADALCVHLNVAQELVQDEGDRDFRGCLETLAELVHTLPLPLIVKETGCGFSWRTLTRLAGAGVRWVDVAGAGGTTWPGVEGLRGSLRQRTLGAELREWGIPTAASIIFARRCGLHTIASGGIRTASDIARALALGANAVALALPFLRAVASGGLAGALEVARTLLDGLRSIALLTGSRRVDDLRQVSFVLGPDLRAWVQSALPPQYRSQLDPLPLA